MVFPEHRRHKFRRLWEIESIMPLITVGCFRFFPVLRIHINTHAFMDCRILQRKIIVILIIRKKEFQLPLLPQDPEAGRLSGYGKGTGACSCLKRAGGKGGLQ